MREVTVYYSYDDKEFFDRDECEQYENKALGLLEELYNAYEFFIANGQEIQLFLSDVDNGLYFFERAWDECDCIKVKKIPSPEAHEFLYVNSGLDMPPNEIGLYRYDFDKVAWVKVE